MRLGKGAFGRKERRRVLHNGVANCRSDFVMRRVGKANVQDRPLIVTRHVDGAVNGFENVGLDQPTLTEYANAGTVTVQKITVLCQL